MRIVDLLRFFRAVAKIPAVEDEAGIREFLRRAAAAAAGIAKYTPTPVDDLATAALAAIVASDEAWAAFYRLLRFAAGQTDLDRLSTMTQLDEQGIMELRDAILDGADYDVVVG